METIITNNYNLKEEDITELTKRVKVLLINSDNEILLGYSHYQYQFPGGHIEDGESNVETINREIKEETGIELNIKDIEPFACAYGYYKDWPEVGKNKKIEIYYYEVRTDDKPNLDNTKYTDSEREGNFELRYIPLVNVENEIIENTKKHGDRKGIAKEMLRALQIYKNNMI